MMSAPSPRLDILIVFYSRFGTVAALAEQIAAGARTVDGVNVSLLAVEERPVGEALPDESEHDLEFRRARTVSRFANADAIVVGAPAYFGSMASPVKRLFEDCVTAAVPPVTDNARPWRHHLFRDKVGAAFTSSATPHGGNEVTLQSILTLMMHLGMVIVTPGQREPLLEHVAAPYGATAVSGAQGTALPTDEEAVAARELGQRVAEVAQWVARGRIAWHSERDLVERGYRPGDHRDEPPPAAVDSDGDPATERPA